MKVGDLVTFNCGSFTPSPRRKLGVICSFDEDNDPIVMWLCSPPWTEANFHYHVRVLSEVISEGG